MADPAPPLIIEESLRGLSEWLIRKYLAEIGARDPASADPADSTGPPSGTGMMESDGWSVSWTTRRIAIVGSSIRLTQFDLRFEGEDGVVQDAFERFMKKAQRGGG